jgi:hypothetical protein
MNVFTIDVGTGPGGVHIHDKFVAYDDFCKLLKLLETCRYMAVNQHTPDGDEWRGVLDEIDAALVDMPVANPAVAP